MSDWIKRLKSLLRLNRHIPDPQDESARLKAQWLEQQVNHLRALRGRTVLQWAAVEIAVRSPDEDSNTLPQWYDESIQALQVDRLDLVLSTAPVATITTYQNNDVFGIYRVDGMPPSQLPTGQPDSIFRYRDLNELPVGEITDVDVIVNDDDIGTVRLRIQGHEILLRAAEVMEEWGGSLRIVEMDER